MERFSTFDIKKFYLGTPLNCSEYVKIHQSDITQEYIDEYELETCTQEGWVYFEIFKVVYGLPQTGKLDNAIIRKRLGASGYNEAATTPGLWLHKWRPIIFLLIADNFGINYVKEQTPLLCT